MTPSMEKYSIEENFRLINKITPILRKKSPVYLFSKSQAFKESVGLKILKDAGVVNRQALVSTIPGYGVLEGRLEKKRKGPDPQNLTAEDNKHYRYTRELWKKMVLMYKELGYEIENPEKSELFGLLKETKVVPWSWEKIKFGYGVEIRNIYCSCRWKVDLRGNKKRMWWCGACDSSPKKSR